MHCKHTQAKHSHCIAVCSLFCFLAVLGGCCRPQLRSDVDIKVLTKYIAATRYCPPWTTPCLAHATAPVHAYNTVHGIRFGAQLQQEQFEALARRVSLVRCTPGHVVVQQGESINEQSCFYIILKGVMDVFVGASGAAEVCRLWCGVM